MGQKQKLWIGLSVLAAMVCLWQAPAARAAADKYPYAGKPCVWSPHAVKGSKANWCADFVWGDKAKDSTAANVISSYGYYYRNCTDYAAWKVHGQGVLPERYKGLGNAKTWAVRAAAKGIKVDGKPAVGSVAVRTTGKYGHTAYVEAVHPGGTIKVSQYNNGADGEYSESTGTPTALGFSAFVHFEVYAPKPPTVSKPAVPAPKPPAPQPQTPPASVPVEPTAPVSPAPVPERLQPPTTAPTPDSSPPASARGDVELLPAKPQPTARVSTAVKTIPPPGRVSEQAASPDVEVGKKGRVRLVPRSVRTDYAAQRSGSGHLVSRFSPARPAAIKQPNQQPKRSSTVAALSLFKPQVLAATAQPKNTENTVPQTSTVPRWPLIGLLASIGVIGMALAWPILNPKNNNP